MYLKIGQFAELVQMNPKTVYRQAQEGNIPGAIKIGRSWRINMTINERETQKQTERFIKAKLLGF